MTLSNDEDEEFVEVTDEEIVEEEIEIEEVEEHVMEEDGEAEVLVLDEEEVVVEEEEDACHMYFDEETVVDDEDMMVEEIYEEEEVQLPAVNQLIKATSHRQLMPLDEEHEVVEVIDEIIEEEVEDDDDLELEGEDADDESSAWIDDGRDYTKNPDAVLPRLFSFQDQFAEDNENSGDEEKGEDDEDAFYLNIPDIEEVSSLEDLSGAEDHSQASSMVMEEVIQEGKEESKHKLMSERVPSSTTLDNKSATSLFNQSVDWDNQHPLMNFGIEDADEADEMMSVGSVQQEVDDLIELKDAFTAHSRLGLSLKRIRQDKPLFYGRQPELERLRAVLAGIDEAGVKNPKRIVWMYGSSGIGKTVLVEYFLREHVKSTETTKYFIGRGGFDERSAQLHTAYSALVDSLTEIVNQLMNDVTDADSTWRDRIGEGLGKEARLLTMLIPNISKLLEVEDDPPEFESTFELATGRLLERLRFVMRRFLRVVCRHRKVVLFLDDIQWADEDSLRMIETILSTHALKNFLFIGCHRGVKRTHMLPQVKTKLSALCAVDIMMKPLEKETVKEITIHILEDEGPEVDVLQAEKLCIWVAEKSAGDPFHLIQLVRYLVEYEHLKKSSGEWRWDIKALRSDDTIPASAVDVVSERIKKLSLETKLVLRSAALLGLCDFHTQTLLRAVQICSSAEKKGGDCPIEDVPALVEHLEDAVDVNLLETLSPGFYEFSHDTIRKAATLLLPKSVVKLSAMHFQIASQLQKEASSLAGTSLEKETLLMLVVDHFSLAKNDVNETADKENIARLNLSLAEGSIRKASFNTAVQRIEYALSLLDQKGRWKDNYDLTLKLHLELSRVFFCQGKFEASKMFADVLLANGKTERDKIGTYELLIWLAVARNNLDEAFRLVSLALKEVWDETPSEDVEDEVTTIRDLLKYKPDAELLMLPEMTHKKTASKLLFLARLAEISWMRQDFLSQDLAALKMVSLTIRYGSSKYSSLSFALYGICLARRNLHKEAFRYGHLAEMTAKADSPLGAQAIAFHHYAIAYWRRPFQASLEPLEKAAVVAIESNDMENLSFRVGAFLSHVFATGSRLNMGDALFRRFKECSIAFRGRETWMVTAPFRLMLKLRGEPLHPAERGFEMYTDPRAKQYLIFFQMIHAVFMQDILIADKLSNKLILKPEGVWLPMRGFMEGLIATSLARASTGKARIKHQRKAAKIIEVLGGWAKNGLKQVYHMASLINVELRMLSDASMQPAEASSLYDNAIAAANKAGFVHHEALANERAGIMFHSQQEDEIATKYLTRACEVYKKWGAHSKIRHIKAKFPRHLDLPDMRAPKSTADHDSYGFSGSGSGPNLDFGESQIIHFEAPEDLAPGEPDSRPVRAPVRGGLASRKASLSKTGRGPPPVRISSSGRGGKVLIRGRSRGRGLAGGRLGAGTPGRGTPVRTEIPIPKPQTEGVRTAISAPEPPVPETEPEVVAPNTNEHMKLATPDETPTEKTESTKSQPETVPEPAGKEPTSLESDQRASEVTSESTPVEPTVVAEERAAAPTPIEPPARPGAGTSTLAQNDKSITTNYESDLSEDDDPLRPSSDRSEDPGTQSDYGPRYKDEKKDKTKRKRRKLKVLRPKNDGEADNDSDDDAAPVRKPRSLHSGLDAFSNSLDVQSDHGPSSHERKIKKMRRKVSDGKQKKEKDPAKRGDSKDVKKVPKQSTSLKSSSKVMAESQKSLNTEVGSSEVAGNTIKRKSKAKLAEDAEKKLKRSLKMKQMDSMLRREGDHSETRKIPLRSRSEGASLSATQEDSQEKEAEEAANEDVEKSSDHSKSKPDRSVSLGGKILKKVKKKSKSVKKSSPRKLGEEEISDSKRDDSEIGAATTSTADVKPPKDLLKKSKSSRQGPVKTKSDTPEDPTAKSLMDSSEPKQNEKEASTVLTTDNPDDDGTKKKSRKESPRRGAGLIRSLSWSGKRKEKAKDEEGGGDDEGNAAENPSDNARPRRSKSFSMGSDSGKKLTKLKKGKKADVISGDGAAKKEKKKGLFSKIKRMTKASPDQEK